MILLKKRSKRSATINIKMTRKTSHFSFVGSNVPIMVYQTKSAMFFAIILAMFLVIILAVFLTEILAEISATKNSGKNSGTKNSGKNSGTKNSGKNSGTKPVLRVFLLQLNHLLMRFLHHFWNQFLLIF